MVEDPPAEEKEGEKGKKEEEDSEEAKIKEEISQLNKKCGEFKSCWECNTDSACGWCDALSKCVGGDEKGPLDGICGYSYYKFGCPGSCSDYTSCQECAQDGIHIFHILLP